MKTKIVFSYYHKQIVRILVLHQMCVISLSSPSNVPWAPVSGPSHLPRTMIWYVLGLLINILRMFFPSGKQEITFCDFLMSSIARYMSTSSFEKFLLASFSLLSYFNIFVICWNWNLNNFWSSVQEFTREYFSTLKQLLAFSIPQFRVKTSISRPGKASGKGHLARVEIPGGKQAFAENGDHFQMYNLFQNVKF